jgi:hypothetical protein
MSPRIAGLALAAALVTATPAAFAIKPFALVEDGYPELKGQLELENTLTFATRSRNEHGFSETALENELEYGLADTFTLRLKGTTVYTSSAEKDGLHFDAGGIEGQYYFSNPNVDKVGVSAIVSVEFGEDTFTNEDFLVIQKDWEKWTVAYNLGVAIDVEPVWGSSDKETAVTLINSLGAVYNLTPQIRAGADISMENSYLEGRVYDSTSVLAGPVMSWTPNEKLWVTGGVEFQLTDNRDEPRYNATLIVGYYFN